MNLFIDLATQWRIGMNGPTGLDHGVLFTRLDRMDLTREESDQMERDVRTMEQQALETMSEEREKREQQAAQQR